ncbi:MAG: N-acetylmuramoyl-L-alanine amidase [Patescibacteria group bacterium]
MHKFLLLAVQVTLRIILGIILGIWIVLSSIVMGVYYALEYAWRKLSEVQGQWNKAVSLGAYLAPILIVLALVLWWPQKKVHRVTPSPRSAPTAKAPIQAPTPDQVIIPDVPQPNMPIKSTGSGSLSNVLVILDPGHGGNTPWDGVDPGCYWQFNGQEYYEAAYTYRMAKELGDMVRAEGGDVAYTAWSPTMEVSTSPRVAMPLPVTPLLPNGVKLTNNGTGLTARADAANALYQAHKAKYRGVFFLSLHIDSMGEGWDGLHVCYDRHASEMPRLAELISQGINEGRYGRRYKGVAKEIVEARGLAVLNRNHNPLKHRVLIELGIPGDPNDSWRLRNEGNRRKMLEKVALRPLLQLAEEVKKRK